MQKAEDEVFFEPERAAASDSPGSWDHSRLYLSQTGGGRKDGAGHTKQI